MQPAEQEQLDVGAETPLTPWAKVQERAAARDAIGTAAAGLAALETEALDHAGLKAFFAALDFLDRSEDADELALAITEQHAQAAPLLARAELLLEKGEGEERRRRLLELVPQLFPLDAPALSHASEIILTGGDPERAEDLASIAVAQNPAHAAGWGILGRIASERLLFDEARGYFDTALMLTPDDPCMLYNMGWAESQSGHAVAASEHLRRLLTIEPRHAQGRFVLAQELLRKGRWREGFHHYEARIDLPEFDNLPEGSRLWRGQRLDGELIVIAEQGFGDVVFFARWLPLVRERVGKLTVLALASRHTLLRALNIFDDYLYPEGHDRGLPVVPLASLPALVDAERPDGAAPPPSLPLKSTRYRPLVDEVLASIGGRRAIGICWRGNPEYLVDRLRSPGIAALAPLAQLQDVVFVPLVHAVTPEEEARSPVPLLAMPQGFDREAPFIDSLELLPHLEAVVSSDTGVAHVAGALDLPLHLALSTPAEYRWGEASQPTPAWYPQLHTYRQAQRGSWDGVFERIADALGPVGAGPLGLGETDRSSVREEDS